MFIAIVGSRFSGKSAVEDYLVALKGFTPLRLTDHELDDLGQTVLVDTVHDDFLDNTSTESEDTASTLNANQDEDDPSSNRDSFLFLSPASVHSHESMQFPQPPALLFSSPTQMLDYVTTNWRRNFVTADLVDEKLLSIFAKRPFFLLVSVDAPVLLRYQRSPRTVKRSLEDFVREHDALLYGHDIGAHQDPFKKQSTQMVSSLHKLAKLVTVHVVNSFTSISSLYAHLDSIDLLSVDRLRPSWDTYFMTLASLASMRSNCMKRRVGAILVRNNRIVSTGYNGAPRGLKNCNDGGCAQCNGERHGREFCLCIHAEENAILEAGRQRCEGAILYCNTCPCLTCTIKIVQAGVKEVIYNLSYKVDEISAKVFEEAGVRLRRYAPPSQE